MKQNRICFGIILIVAVFFAWVPVRAQVSSIKGIITDSQSGKPVEYAEILNYSKNKATYSKSNGEFRLVADAGDTLLFHALGYYYEKVIVPDSSVHSQKVLSFYMNQAAFELPEARIIGSGSYEDFKKAFVKLDRPITPTEQLNSRLAQTMRNEGREAYDEALEKGEIKSKGLGVSILTRDERERIKLAEIEEKEAVRDQMYRKFNPQVVKQVTGLTDDDEIIRFMAYCNFKEKYLLAVNEYDLMEEITRKYEMFKQRKVDEKTKENQINSIDDLENTLA
jgi:hypothetical protein